MGLIRFEGTVKSKRFDEYGNCYIGLNIHDCYAISHINNVTNIGAHVPRCNEFKIINERPLSCVNNIDIARYSDIGDYVTIKAYELYNTHNVPVNMYHTVELN